MTWARWWEPAVVSDVPAAEASAEDQEADEPLAAITLRAQPLLFDIPEAPGRPAPRVVVGDTRSAADKDP